LQPLAAAILFLFISKLLVPRSPCRLSQKAEIKGETENDERMNDRKPKALLVKLFIIFIFHGAHPFSLL